MAKATVKTTTEVTLILSEQEAKVLRTILARVSGFPAANNEGFYEEHGPIVSARGHANNIDNALGGAGIHTPYNEEYFKTNPAYTGVFFTYPQPRKG
jgi:hypothetical protein